MKLTSERGSALRETARLALLEQPLTGGISELTVSPGRFFVLGDNRDNSRDSRHFGLLPADHVVGRPLVIWFSQDLLTLARRILPARWSTT